MEPDFAVLDEVVFCVDDGVDHRIPGEYGVAPLIHRGKIGVKLLYRGVGMAAIQQNANGLKLVDHIVPQSADDLRLLLETGIVLGLAFQKQLGLLLVQLQLMELIQLLKGMHEHIVYDDQENHDDCGADGKRNDICVGCQRKTTHKNKAQQN